MSKYNSYKSSGIDWLGEIPSHWSLKKVKELYLDRNERNIDFDKTFLSITKDRGVIPYSEKGNVGNKTSDDIKKYKKVYINDLVINPMNVIIGSVGLSKYNGVLSGVYMVLISKNNFNPKYGSYIFNISSFQKYLKKICYGLMELRESLNKIEFFVEKLPVPTLEEQYQIVQFLDEKTELIDKLISTKERKITLLKEQRTSLINKVVTKGLNPNVKMKDSGVEWIGKIPEHWMRTKIVRFCKVKDGTHDTPEYIDDIENSIPLVTSNSFVNGMIDFTKSKRISRKDYIEINKRSDVTKGDIIMSMIGSNIGNKVLVNSYEEFSIKNVCLFKTSSSTNLIPKYLLFLLESRFLEIQVDHSQKGGGQPFLSLDDLRNLIFPFPSVNEQLQIVEYLDFKTKEIDDLVHLEQKKIDTLKEYRQSLISEVVTGKIKVTTDE